MKIYLEYLRGNKKNKEETSRIDICTEQKNCDWFMFNETKSRRNNYQLKLKERQNKQKTVLRQIQTQNYRYRKKG